MRISIDFSLYEYPPNKKDYKWHDEHDVEFEFIAVQELVGDVERFMSETIKMYLENLEIINATEKKSLIGSRVLMSADVLGVQIEKQDTLTEDFEHRQKLKEINHDSLQNDIRYIDSLLVSEAPVLDIRKWVYHMLEKHYEIPIPEALRQDAPVESKPVEK